MYGSGVRPRQCRSCPSQQGCSSQRDDAARRPSLAHRDGNGALSLPQAQIHGVLVELTVVPGQGHNPVVETLLAANAQVDAHDGDGNVPLALGCLGGHLGCVRTLLQVGADVNGSPGDNSSPLLHAVDEGHEAVVKELLATPGIQVRPHPTQKHPGARSGRRAPRAPCGMTVPADSPMPGFESVAAGRSSALQRRLHCSVLSLREGAHWNRALSA